MEWELTVELPNSSKNTKPLPFLKKIKNERIEYNLIYWKIDKTTNIKDFVRFIKKSNTTNIGLLFVIKQDITIEDLMEHFLAIPTNFKIRGVLFNDI